MIKIRPDDDDSVLPTIEHKLVPMGRLREVSNAATKFLALFDLRNAKTVYMGSYELYTENDIEDLNYMLDRLEETIKTARKEPEE